MYDDIRDSRIETTMGQTDTAQQQKRDARKSGGAGKAPWEPRTQEGPTLNWVDVDDEVVIQAIVSASSHEASIQFTISRDRGALGVRVYDDRHKTKTVWASHEDEMVEILQAIIDHYTRKPDKERQK